MSRSSFEGRQKGSTLKSRGKVVASRALNIALSVVLVVGLAPGMSYARQDSQKGEPASSVATQADSLDANSTRTDGEDAEKDKDKENAVDSSADDSVNEGAGGSANGNEEGQDKDSGSSNAGGDASSSSNADDESGDSAADDTPSASASASDASNPSSGASGSSADKGGESDSSGSTAADGKGGSSSGEKGGTSTSASSKGSSKKSSSSSAADEKDDEDEGDDSNSNDSATTKNDNKDVNYSDLEDPAEKLEYQKEKKRARGKLLGASSDEDPDPESGDSSDAGIDIKIVKTDLTTPKYEKAEGSTTTEYYDEDVKFKVTFTDPNFKVAGEEEGDPDQVGTVSFNNGEPLDAGKVTATENENEYTAEFALSEAEAPTDVKVTVTNPDGKSESKTYANKIVIDKDVPQVQGEGFGITWKPDDSGEYGDGTETNAKYFVNSESATVSATATVTVKDLNLNVPDSADGFTDDKATEWTFGEAEKITKVSAKGENLVAKVTQPWKPVSEGSDTYSCEIQFTSTGDLANGSEFKPEVDLTAFDLVEKESSASSTFTMNVVLDEDAPRVAATKNPNPENPENEINIASGGKVYFKEGDIAQVSLTEANYDASKLSATFNGTPIEWGTPSGNVRTADLAFSNPEKKPSVEYSLTVSGTDKAGNPVADKNGNSLDEAGYSATLVYDDVKPEVASITTKGKSDTDGKDIKTGETQFVNGDQTITVTFNEGEELKEVKVTPTKNGEKQDELTATVLAESGNVATFPLSAMVDNDEYSFSITATDKAGNEMEAAYTTGTIKVDKEPPTVSVKWNCVESDSYIGSMNGDTTAQYIVGKNTTTLEAEATITAIDPNFIYPEGSDWASTESGYVLGDDDTTKITASGDNLTAEITSPWSGSEGEYTCTVKFTYEADPAEDITTATELAPNLSINAKDKAKNSAPSDSSATMKVTEKDETAPVVVAKKGEGASGTEIENGGTAYFNDADDNKNATIELKEKHSGKGKPVVTVNESSVYSAFGELGDDDVRAMPIEFGSAGYDSEGIYNLSASGTDLVGNQMVDYLATLIYDTTEPKIESVGTSSTDSNNLATGQTVIVNSEQTVIVKMSDLMDTYDGYPDSISYKVMKETEADPVEVASKEKPVDKDNQISIPIDDFEQVAEGNEATFYLVLKANDKSGNTSEYTSGKLVVDKKAPVVAVSWENSPKNPAMHDEVEYYESRTATITVTETNFSADAMKVDATRGVFWDKDTDAATTDGKPKWTLSDGKYSAIVKYTEKGECTLQVTGEDLAENAAEGDINEATFQILPVPEMAVSFSPAPSDTIRVDDKETYVLDDNGKLTVTITVRDADFNADNYSAASSGVDLDNSGTIEWDTTAQGDLVHTGTITYSKDGDVTSLTIQGPADLVGTEATDGAPATAVDDKGKYTKENFVIDNTPPTIIEVSGLDLKNDGTDKEIDNVYHFNAERAAEVKVKEKHLNSDGSPISVSLEQLSDPVSTTKYNEPTISEDVFTYSGIELAKVTEQEIKYRLIIKGEDLVEKALVKEDSVKAVIEKDDAYRRDVIIDNWGPRLSVKYSAHKTSGDTFYNNGKVTATITVTDMSLDDGKEITITDKYGATEKTHGLTRSKEDPTTYSATVELDNEGSVEHTLTISGADLVSNPMIAADDSGITVTEADGKGTYTQKVRIDKTSPKLAVTSTKTPYKTDGNKHYYNYNDTLGELAIDGFVKDEIMLKKEGITATVSGDASVSNKGPAADQDEFQNIFAPGSGAYAISKDGTYRVKVSGTDLAGNKMAADTAVDGNFAKEKACLVDGNYESVIIYDATLPTVDVTYSAKKPSKKGSLAFNDKAVVGNTVTVTAKFNDASGIDRKTTSFKYTLKGATKNAEVEWIDDSTAQFTLDAEAGKVLNYKIKIDGKDTMDNDLAGDPTESTKAQPYVANISIDQNTPDLKVSFERADGKTTEHLFDKATADEVRYYNGDVKAVITVNEDNFIAENILVNDRPTSDADWTHDGRTHTYKDVWYQDEGKVNLTVSGTDEYENKMESAEKSTTFVSDGAYKTKIVMDKTRPTVEVRHGSTNDIAFARKVANGSEVVRGQDQYLFVTVTESLSFNESLMDDFYKIYVTPDANIIRTKGGNVWKSNGDGTYTATLFISADGDKNQDSRYNLRVRGRDLAGNSFAEPYKSTFWVDKKVPTLSVSFSRVAKVIDDQNTAKETRFYPAGTTVEAKVRIVEQNHKLNLNKVSFTVNDAEVEDIAPVNDERPNKNGAYVYIGTATMKPGTVDSLHTITVKAKDNVGNAIVSANEDNTSPYVENGTYTSKVYLDNEAPQINVRWTPAKAVNGKYFNKKRTAKISVRESEFNFVPTSFLISQNGAKATSYELKDWSHKNGVYSLEVPFEFGESTANQFLTVTGKDRVGNRMVFGSDNAKPKAGNVNKGGTYRSANFIVDLTKPRIDLSLNKLVKGTLEGKDGEGRTNFFNDDVTGVITVTDANFMGNAENAAGETVVTPTGGEAVNGKWQKLNDTTKAYKVKYGENGTKDNPAKKSDLEVTVYDYAGNKAEYSYGPTNDRSKTLAAGKELQVGSSAFVVDKTDPKVLPRSGDDIPTTGFVNQYGDDNAASIFYNADVTMRFRIVDNLGLDSTVIDDVTGDYLHSNDVEAGATVHDISIGVVEGKEFDRDVILTVVDMAKNRRVWSLAPDGTVRDVTGEYGVRNTRLYNDLTNLYAQRAIKDTTPPVLTFEAPEAGQFFNTSQTVRLNVEELNFRDLVNSDAGQNVVTIESRQGDAGTTPDSGSAAVGDFTPQDAMAGLYSWEKTFENDGHYSLTADLIDPSLNTASTARVEEFTIDKTAPTVEVTWDNNSAQNGMYYKAARTATIVVTEHNFDPSSFTIDTTGSISGWSDDGDRHTATVSYSSGGRYTLTVSGRDRAGNELATYNEPEFVVDLTAPTIDFSNVEASTAYNDYIAPVINYHDEANFNASGMTYTLTGSKHGERSDLSAGQSSSGNDGAVSFSDFTRDVEYDDIYTLQAHLVDMAGNEAENSITFSVNRFGSNFIVLDSQAYTEHNGYLVQPREVQVQEINVSGNDATGEGVTVTHGLVTDNLQQNTQGTPTSTGYYVTQSNDSAGWSQYTYHIGSGNFVEDGNYHVVIRSTDVATNLNNSASYFNPDKKDTDNAEVSFILDTADPIIDNVSVTNGGLYDANQTTVSFVVIDNIGLDRVEVTVDGETKTVEPGMGGQCVVDLPAMTNHPRDLNIIATDFAGRTASSLVNGFRYTTDFVELNLPLVIGGCVVLAVVVIGGVLIARRRMS